MLWLFNPARARAHIHTYTHTYIYIYTHGRFDAPGGLFSDYPTWSLFWIRPPTWSSQDDDTLLVPLRRLAFFPMGKGKKEVIWICWWSPSYIERPFLRSMVVRDILNAWTTDKGLLKSSVNMSSPTRPNWIIWDTFPARVLTSDTTIVCYEREGDEQKDRRSQPLKKRLESGCTCIKIKVT